MRPFMRDDEYDVYLFVQSLRNHPSRQKQTRFVGDRINTELTTGMLLLSGLLRCRPALRQFNDHDTSTHSPQPRMMDNLAS